MEDTGSELIIEHSASTEPSDILVPRYNYKGYHVYDDEDNEYEIRDGINNLITFTPPENAGKLYVRFVEPWYWRVAEIISVLSLAAVSPSLIKRKRRNGEIASGRNNDEENEHTDSDTAGENHDADDYYDADDSNDEKDNIKIAC